MPLRVWSALHAFQGATGGDRPTWVNLDCNVKALVDLTRWPEDMGFAFMRVDKTVPAARDDFEARVEESMFKVAHLSEWSRDPEAEKAAPDGMIVRRISLDALDPSTRARLAEALHFAQKERREAEYQRRKYPHQNP